MLVFQQSDKIGGGEVRLPLAYCELPCTGSSVCPQDPGSSVEKSLAMLRPKCPPCSPRPHPAVDIYEGRAGFLGELLTAQDLLEQGLLEGFSCVTPQPVLTAGLGHHDTAQRVLGWGPVQVQRCSAPTPPQEAGGRGPGW